MRKILFEDDGWRRFLPLTALRSLLEVRCGILPLWEKGWLASGGDIDFLALRPGIRASAEKKFEKFSAPAPARHPTGSGSALWLNARVLWNADLLAETADLNEGEACLLPGGGIAAAVASIDSASSDPGADLEGAVQSSRKVDWPHLDVWYDLLEAGPAEIAADLTRLDRRPETAPADVPAAVHLLGEGGVHLGTGVILDPGAVIDTRHGPVVLEDGVHLMPGAVVAGPCYLGRDSRVKSGAVLSEGCSLGDSCRVGGELENVFMQGYANKQHDGYLGNAVLGAWVNLGAATNNSDLKNTYGEVSTIVDGASRSSGRMFLGCCLGDHVKTAIGTTLITGMVAGTGCNLFGPGFHPVSVPAFIWGQPGNYKEYRLERVIETARIVMGRRDVEMTAEYEVLLNTRFAATAAERDTFLSRLQHSRTAARRRGEC